MPALISTGAPSAENLNAFSIRVREHPLDLRRVRTNKREVVRQAKLDRMIAPPRTRVGQSARHDVTQVAPVGLRMKSAGLDPRQVEQVRDHPVQPLRLLVEHRQKLVAVALVLGIAQAGESCRDRGQRRAQVVRDRMQHRRLRDIRAGCRLRLRRPLGHPLALQSEIEQLPQRLAKPLEGRPCPSRTRSPHTASRSSSRSSGSSKARRPEAPGPARATRAAPLSRTLRSAGSHRWQAPAPPDRQRAATTPRRQATARRAHGAPPPAPARAPPRHARAPSPQAGSPPRRRRGTPRAPPGHRSSRSRAGSAAR